MAPLHICTQAQGLNYSAIDLSICDPSLYLDLSQHIGSAKCEEIQEF